MNAMMTPLVSRALCVTLQGEIAAAVTPILERHGLTLAPNPRGKYGYEFSMTIVGVNPAMVSESGVDLQSKEAQEYARMAQMSVYEASRPTLDPNAVGKTFNVGGEALVFVGANPRAPKYPYQFRKQDGRVYRYPRLTGDRILALPGPEA